MSIVSIEYPLSPVRMGRGIVPEPIVPIKVFRGRNEFMYDFLLDSGADFTLLPKSVALQLGVNLSRCPTSFTMGVEGGKISVFHAQISVGIGPWRDRIRCAFANHDNVPPLLGRLDLFSKFNVTFHAGRQSIIFERKKEILRKSGIPDLASRSEEYLRKKFRHEDL